jgi:Gnt-I system high-affinity gluconate transporter
MTILIVILSIVFLVLLITLCKINPFIAFLIVSILAGLLLGIPLNKVTKSVEKGIGDILAGLVILITLGAMLGKLIAESGAAQRISTVLMNMVGVKNVQWALMISGFIIGIPLFYSVGFILMVPLIFSVVHKYKLPAVYVGLPMLGSLSVAHGFLPPHPAPSAIIVQLNASMGLTLLYGFILAIPAIIIAGPVFSSMLKNIPSKPSHLFIAEELPEDKLPGTANSFLTALLPVILLMGTTLFLFIFPESPKGSISNIITFVGEPSVVMLIVVIIATFSLGISQGRSIESVMNIYLSAVKDIAMILLIIAGAGALKQVLAESGVSDQIAALLQNLHMQPLLLGWLIAAIIRVCVGSATIAGLTTAGIIAPLMVSSQVNPNLMVLSIGAGSLMFSHVNDGAFWMFKEYFNLSIKDTIRSWSLMESIASFVGLAGVLLLNLVI